MRLLLLFVAIMALRGTAPAAPRLFVGLPPGEHAVGFRVDNAAGTRVARWYPANSRGTARTMRDYLGGDDKGLRDALRGAGVPAADVDAFAAAPMLASTGAIPERGPFPLVVVAQGNGQSDADQAVLCEFLASRGFVVATTPSPTRTEPMRSDDDIPIIADRQARDLASAAALVSREAGNDKARISVVGYSFGARAALLLAMRDPRVDTIVSLDGGIGTATGRDAFRRSPQWNPGVRARILHFYERRDAFMTPEFTLLDGLKFSAVEKLAVAGLGHAHFTSLGFAAAAFPSIAVATHAGESVAADVRTVATRTLAFISAR
jgi:dienelactone hydrolase